MKRFNLSSVIGSTVLVAAGIATAPAQAQVSFNIIIAPPAPIYESIPLMAQGYIWAPGYWAWHGDRHIWVHGRSIVQRSGYRWEPDRWDQRGPGYYQVPGHWQPAGHVVVAPKHKPPKVKHNNGNGNGNGNGKGNSKKDEHGRQQDH